LNRNKIYSLLQKVEIKMILIFTKFCQLLSKWSFLIESLKGYKSCFLAFCDYYLSLKRLKQTFWNTAEKDSVSICIWFLIEFPSIIIIRKLKKSNLCLEISVHWLCTLSAISDSIKVKKIQTIIYRRPSAKWGVAPSC
jgi:hypothetical protein